MKTYIYSLVNPIDNSIFYIGKSNNPNRRVISHVSSAFREHKNKRKSNLIFEILNAGLYPDVKIIEEIDDSEWEEKERYYISYYRNNGINLLNKLPGGEHHPDWTGKVHTEETKRKISEANKGKKRIVRHPCLHRKPQSAPRWNKGLIGWNGKKVYQYDLSGKYLNTFNSTKHAEIETGITQSSIVRCCNGAIYRAKDSIFSYEYHPEGIKPFKYIHEVEVDCFSISGEFIRTFGSLIEAAKETGVSKSNISAVLRGFQKTCGGYVWKYHITDTRSSR